MLTDQLTEASMSDALPRAVPDFAGLVREHQAMVFSVALHFLQDRATAEEIAQDVFLELHQALPTLGSPEYVLHWLRRVAVHRSIDAIRRRRPTLALVAVREPAVAARDGDVLLESLLRDLVASLPEKARMAVIRGIRKTWIRWKSPKYWICPCGR